MKRLRARMRCDERGASLVLAIGFMVMAGAIGAGLTTSIASSVGDGSVLTVARNREYAADGAIESAITQVRTNMTSGSALAPCGAPVTQTLNNIQIQVDCSYVPTLSLSGFWQRDAIFTAYCPSSAPPACQFPITRPIIRAQVDFASTSPKTATTITVDRTYVQSWSVDA